VWLIRWWCGCIYRVLIGARALEGKRGRSKVRWEDGVMGDARKLGGRETGRMLQGIGTASRSFWRRTWLKWGCCANDDNWCMYVALFGSKYNTETCWRCFNVNFNIVFFTTTHWCISWWINKTLMLSYIFVKVILFVSEWLLFVVANPWLLFIPSEQFLNYEGVLISP